MLFSFAAIKYICKFLVKEFPNTVIFFVQSVSLHEIIKRTSVDRADIWGWNCGLPAVRGAETEAAEQAENQVSEEEGVSGPRRILDAQRGGSC